MFVLTESGNEERSVLSMNESNAGCFESRLYTRVVKCGHFALSGVGLSFRKNSVASRTQCHAMLRVALAIRCDRPPRGGVPTGE